MHHRILGKTGLEVSLMSFGTGGPSGFGGAEGSEREERRKVVRRCLELGINFFDTSAHYGGSEEILGWALEGVPRDSYYLATKWAATTWWSPGGVGGEDGPLHEDPQALAEGVDASLKRLQTDHIDVMFFHGLRPKHYDVVVERFYPVMLKLREAGKIRFLGVSGRYIVDPSHETVTIAMKKHPEYWDAVMLKYGILNQYAAREALPLAMKHGIGVINMSAVRSKLSNQDQLKTLIADWKDRSIISGDSVPDDDPLGWLVHDEVESVISAGYKFGADHEAIATVLSGTTNLSHLEANVRVMEKPVSPPKDKKRLQELFGHIAEWA